MLRLIYPKFQYAAQSRYETSATRIWARLPHSRYTRPHPDSGQPHVVIHNNLGLHQDRDFPPGSLQGAVNIACFGDSFTENLRLPAPYRFTEPLDFLLNLHGRRFNVLNHGVDGYGTDQAYLAYREFPEREHLSHVLYLFCSNDVRNIRESRLFALNPAGDLVVQPAPPSSPGVRLLARFHLTYLAIAAYNALSNHSRDHLDLPAYLEHARNKKSADVLKLEQDFRQNLSSPELTDALRLMEKIIRTWQHEVEAHGGDFHIVILPLESERHAAAYFAAAGLPVIDLGAGTQELAPGAGASLVFQNDGHWNERGNMIGAMRLRQALGEREGLPPMTPDEMRRALDVYYSAFGGWTPGPSATAPAGDRDAIRRKYTALE